MKHLTLQASTIKTWLSQGPCQTMKGSWKTSNSRNEIWREFRKLILTSSDPPNLKWVLSSHFISLDAKSHLKPKDIYLMNSKESILLSKFDKYRRKMKKDWKMSTIQTFYRWLSHFQLVRSAEEEWYFLEINIDIDIDNDEVLTNLQDICRWSPMLTFSPRSRRSPSFPSQCLLDYIYQYKDRWCAS